MLLVILQVCICHMLLHLNIPTFAFLCQISPHNPRLANSLEESFKITCLLNKYMKFHRNNIIAILEVLKSLTTMKVASIISTVFFFANYSSLYMLISSW